MPYAPPVVFVAGTPVSGPDLSANLVAASSYLSGGIVGGDLAAAPNFSTHHFLKGKYHPLINQHEFTTGVVAGRYHQGQAPDVPCHIPMADSRLDHTGLPVTWSPRLSSAQWRMLSRTAVTFRLERNARVIFTATAYPISLNDQLDDAYGPHDYRTRLGDTIFPVAGTLNLGDDSMAWGTSERAWGNTDYAPGWERRQPINIVHRWAVGPGDWSIVICGQSETSHCCLTKLQYTLEAYYY